MKYRLLAPTIGLAFCLAILTGSAIVRSEPLQGARASNHSRARLMSWDQTLLGARIFLGQLPSVMPGSENDTRERIALGKRLFFDRSISHNSIKSCADCHHLTGGRAGADDTPTSEGASGAFGTRNTPTVLNAGFQFAQFWDGRAADLAEQAKGPILNQIEMGMLSPNEVIEKLRQEEGYVEAFRRAFPGQDDPMTYDNLAEAIAAFERTLVAPGRFDRMLAGDQNAMNDQEKRGLTKFLQYRCVECHGGVTVGGRHFRILGQQHPFRGSDDLGRYQVTKKIEDRYFFKVPMLRNVTRTAPYFDAGQVFTLEEAVSLMAWHQLNLRLTSQDRLDLIAFLITLEGNPPISTEDPASLLQGRQGLSPMAAKITIPDKLHIPKNEEFIQRLREALAFDRLAKAQYEADKDKYKAKPNPYANLIAQEDDHVKRLTQLFKAYGLPADSKKLAVSRTSSPKHAFEVGRNLEKDLFPLYSWLIANAEEPVSRSVFHVILHQTEMHYLWLGGSPDDVAEDHTE